MNQRASATNLLIGMIAVLLLIIAVTYYLMVVF